MTTTQKVAQLAAACLAAGEFPTADGPTLLAAALDAVDMAEPGEVPTDALGLLGWVREFMRRVSENSAFDPAGR